MGKKKKKKYIYIYTYILKCIWKKLHLYWLMCEINHFSGDADVLKQILHLHCSVSAYRPLIWCVEFAILLLVDLGCVAHHSFFFLFFFFFLEQNQVIVEGTLLTMIKYSV